MSSYKHLMRVSSKIQDYDVWLTKSVPIADYYIIDEKVYKLYNEQYHYPDNHLLLRANERTKSWSYLSRIIKHLIDQGIKRNDRICVIGGGTIQDVASFIASIYKRGIEWVYAPTTLLAQCDSCIGSKTSINYGRYKNQIGTFYPPRHVYINTDYIKTLKKRDIYSGIGEIIKIHLINGKFLHELEKDLEKKDWERIIFRSLLFKKRYIELDEYDWNERRILNYGHTFGHAIESVTNYKVPHGQAVMLGMQIANYISWKEGLLSVADAERMNEIMMPYLPRVNLYDIDSNMIREILLKDKKVSDNKLEMILTRGPGNMFRHKLNLDKVMDYYNEWLEIV